MAAKLTFRQIREQRFFDVTILAIQAGVEHLVVMQMLRGQPVYKSQAEKVLSALSVMHQQLDHPYTLETVNITYFPEQGQARV